VSFSLAGRGALVTGAARGLGRAMADALEAAGARVKSVDLADGVDLSALTADRATELVAAAREELGDLSILVNNAGAISRSPAEDTAEEDWRAIVALNLTAPFLLAQAFARDLLDQRGGSIVNVVSMNAFHGGMNVPAYTATKTGLLGLTRALANEWTGRGVRVNAIAPGWMETDLTAALREDQERFAALSSRIPAGRWGKPEDLGGTVVFLASDASAYVSGAVLPIDGGYLVR
jgi:2-dehydro-3-deoxy-D-gluconate 5-dehydrogenase